MWLISSLLITYQSYDCKASSQHSQLRNEKAQASLTKTQSELEKLGDIQFEKGDFSSALKTFRRLTLLQPNDIDILLKLADVAKQAGDLDEAIKRARAATTIAPESAKAHLILAKYLDYNKDFKAAFIQYERVLELTDGKDRSLNDIRFAAFGPSLRLLISMGELAQADRKSRQWLAQNPSNADCHFNRAWLLSQQQGEKALNESVKEYRQAMSLDNSLANAHYNLALVLVKLNRIDEAVAELKIFLSACPNDRDASSARELLNRLMTPGNNHRSVK